jgi:26S proteasome regulatory subunit N10
LVPQFSESDFIGSPVHEDEASLVKLAKKLKKNNIAVDLVCFGEMENVSKLETFIQNVNSNDNRYSTQLDTLL